MDDSLLKATSYGIGWANSGGEAVAVCPENSLAVDGIENVIRVLEEVENNKLSDLTFLEVLRLHRRLCGRPAEL